MGLYTRDRFSGEDAPAGPMYNRDATLRLAWTDPVGWAGLDKVPPTINAIHLARVEQERLRQRQHELRNRLGELADEANSLGIRLDATRDQLHLAGLRGTLNDELARCSTELRILRNEYADNQAMIDALERHVARVEAGDRGPLRAHITHAHRPSSSDMDVSAAASPISGPRPAWG